MPVQITINIPHSDVDDFLTVMFDVYEMLVDMAGHRVVTAHRDNVRFVDPNISDEEHRDTYIMQITCSDERYDSTTLQAIHAYACENTKTEHSDLFPVETTVEKLAEFHHG